MTFNEGYSVKAGIQEELKTVFGGSRRDIV